MIDVQLNGWLYTFRAVEARTWEAWNVSLLGTPKFTFICGACGQRRKMRPLRDNQTGLAIGVCYCGQQNLFPYGGSYAII